MSDLWSMWNVCICNKSAMQRVVAASGVVCLVHRWRQQMKPIQARTPGGLSHLKLAISVIVNMSRLAQSAERSRF